MDYKLVAAEPIQQREESLSQVVQLWKNKQQTEI